ncbi:AzlD domain-containing protein [Curvibacter sp. CHRR-16]|uniref:AzlD domain-containing protein n=1 Tax=Curvibacter sp. CHRR-16 TaxID=2835872 RepID=UPI001BD91E15|nr:AzlD domain-containing protein [Curvibacter sp. CHRR-16]MBT0568782.1 AzlD domain-containing protein [Curvibacter sp. CHRR-16]
MTHSLSTTQLLLATGGLAAGTFGLRLLGVQLGGRLARYPRLQQYLQTLSLLLLAGLGLSATLLQDGAYAGHARVLGVASALLLAWRGAPLYAVVLCAAVVAALSRWMGM